MKQFIIKQWRHDKQRLFVVIVGIVLLTIFLQAALGLSYVLRLIPVIITIIVCIAVVFWQAPLKAKLWASTIIVVCSYILEVIGAQAGFLFGDFAYSKLLGFTLFGVPLTIGLIWLSVSLSAWNIASYSKAALWQKFIVGGLLVVMLDLILEQFASAYGLWSWQRGTASLYNYVCWFGISIIWFYVLNRISPKMQPSLFAIYILPIIAIFFWLMLIIA